MAAYIHALVVVIVADWRVKADGLRREVPSVVTNLGGSIWVMVAVWWGRLCAIIGHWGLVLARKWIKSYPRITIVLTVGTIRLPARWVWRLHLRW